MEVHSTTKRIIVASDLVASSSACLLSVSTETPRSHCCAEDVFQAKLHRVVQSQKQTTMNCRSLIALSVIALMLFHSRS